MNTWTLTIPDPKLSFLPDRAVCPVCPVEKLPRRRIKRHGASEKKPDGFASPGSGG